MTRSAVVIDRKQAEAQIREGIDKLRLFDEPGSISELRILKAGRFKTISGYFDNPDDLVKEALRLDAEDFPGLYVVMNPINPALLARAVNRAKPYAENATTDSDILRRRWFLVDLDAIRPSGISSTDAEHDLALDRARQIREYLRGQGWPEPVFADSGNGSHLFYSVDLPNDDTSRDLVRRVLEGLASLFDDDRVTVDQSVFNAGRIVKLPGTMARKGDDTPDRPHRRARILEVPHACCRHDRAVAGRRRASAEADRTTAPAWQGFRRRRLDRQERPPRLA